MIGSVDFPVEVAGELFLGCGGAASGIRLGSDVALMEGLAAAMCSRWVGGAGGDVGSCCCSFRACFCFR